MFSSRGSFFLGAKEDIYEHGRRDTPVLICRSPGDRPLRRRGLAVESGSCFRKNDLSGTPVEKPEEATRTLASQSSLRDRAGEFAREREVRTAATTG